MRQLLAVVAVLLAVTAAGVGITRLAATPGERGAPASAPSPSGDSGAETGDAGAETGRGPSGGDRAAQTRPRPSPTRLPLRGTVVALDPGHQLGNARFPEEVNALVEAGGFRKPCNTTGTATDAGVPEATVVWELAVAVRARLEALGAQVRLTRERNSTRSWGPCVDDRGRFGARVGADLMVSLHADGNSPSARGFHVIAPQRRPGRSDLAADSLRLATQLRDALSAAGIPRSTYVGGGTGLDVRPDLGTLNLSDVPAAMVEIGNMRNTGDAARMTSARGRQQYARAVAQAIRTHLRP